LAILALEGGIGQFQNLQHRHIQFLDIRDEAYLSHQSRMYCSGREEHFRRNGKSSR
jgi:hypothetical protein